MILKDASSQTFTPRALNIQTFLRCDYTLYMYKTVLAMAVESIAYCILLGVPNI